MKNIISIIFLCVWFSTLGIFGSCGFEHDGRVKITSDDSASSIFFLLAWDFMAAPGCVNVNGYSITITFFSSKTYSYGNHLCWKLRKNSL